VRNREQLGFDFGPENPNMAQGKNKSDRKHRSCTARPEDIRMAQGAGHVAKDSK
jgi:hypothetical protein